MNNQELIDLLLLQTNITTVILAFTALILSGIFLDILVHLYKKHIKKGEKNEKNIISSDYTSIIIIFIYKKIYAYETGSNILTNNNIYYYIIHQ